MALTLLPPAPDPYNDTPTEFGAKAATFVKAQQDMVPELNAMLASLDSVAAGGALSIPYTFSAILTDSDPGAGKLRLNTTGQSSATVIRCDLLSSNGEDLTAVLDQFATSTSATKGDIRLVKSGDVTKWLSFKLTAAASPAGYRNFTVTYVGGSSASPFVDGDGLVLFFTRNGDRGDVASNTAFTPVPMAALDMNLATGNYFTKTISTNSTFTFSNIPAGGSSWTLELKMDGGSAAFPASVRPVDGVARTMATGKTHRIMFVTSDGGAKVGMVIAPNFAN